MQNAERNHTNNAVYLFSPIGAYQLSMEPIGIQSKRFPDQKHTAQSDKKES